MKHSGTVYKGLIKNISNFATYSAKFKVAFNYSNYGEDYSEWDSKTKLFKLRPGEKKAFEFVSRIAPDSFEMQCSRDVTIEFIESTYKR